MLVQTPYREKKKREKTKERREERELLTLMTPIAVYHLEGRHGVRISRAMIRRVTAQALTDVPACGAPIRLSLPVIVAFCRFLAPIVACFVHHGVAIYSLRIYQIGSFPSVRCRVGRSDLDV